MDIHSTKIELVKTILSIKNNDFIQKVAEFIKNENADFWSELTLSEQNEIREGINKLDKGKRVSYDSFLKKIS